MDVLSYIDVLWIKYKVLNIVILIWYLEYLIYLNNLFRSVKWNRKVCIFIIKMLLIVM